MRVGAAERDGRSGDPAFPKKQWPTVEQCARCHPSGGGPGAWDEVEVLHYLQDFYGVTQPRSSGTRKHLGSLNAEATVIDRCCQEADLPCALLDVQTLHLHVLAFQLLIQLLCNQRRCSSGGCGLNTGLRLWQECWQQREHRSSSAGRRGARHGRGRGRGEDCERNAAQLSPHKQVQELLMLACKCTERNHA